ncbi:MAG TPA: hypothetical protein VN630_07950 [Rhodanobacteraceae bacterium]|nr:hypothetical protein [Rhodanobacteraceae bacterium]
MASIALAPLEAGAADVLLEAGAAAVEAGAAIAFEAALAAEAAALEAWEAALAACEAALAAAEAALAAFCCASLAADWSPELLPQADNERAIAVATAATSTVRVNFIGDLLDWAVESHGSGLRIKPRLAE